MRLVSIAGKAWAIGLWWQIRSGGPAKRNVMLKEACEQAKTFKEEYNYVATRTDQYGLGFLETPLPAKTYSLISSLRTDGQDTFLGIFHLDEDVWWVCAIVRGMIAADGDSVCATQEDALRVIRSIEQLIDVQGARHKVFSSQEASLEYLEERLAADSPIVPLNLSEISKQKLIKSLSLVALISVCVVLGLLALSVYQERESQRVRDLAAAERRVKLQKQIDNPELVFKKGWETEPTVWNAAAQCLNVIGALPIAEQGWLLDVVSCLPGQHVRIGWTHRKGADFRALPGNGVLVSPQKAQSTQTLAKLPARPEEVPLKQPAISALLYQLTQNLGSKLNLKWEPREQLKIDEKTTIYSPWLRGTVELAGIPTAAVMDAELYEALTSLPGFTLTVMEYKNGTVLLKGAVYASQK